MKAKQQTKNIIFIYFITRHFFNMEILLIKKIFFPIVINLIIASLQSITSNALR